MSHANKRKRVKGQAISRSLVHIDKQAKDQLALLSKKTTIPMAQLMNIAIDMLVKATDQLASEAPDAR
jgi:hypothetical protein